MTRVAVMREPIPEATRAAVRKRSGGRCEQCGAIATDMHHLTYYREDPSGRFLESIFGFESADDLDHLCRECHRGRHRDINGDYWADPEEMAAHWQGYWDALGKDD